MAPEFIVGADGVWRAAQRVVVAPPPPFVIAPVFPGSYRRTRAYFHCEYRESAASTRCTARANWRLAKSPFGRGQVVFGSLCTRHRRLLLDAADYNK